MIPPHTQLIETMRVEPDGAVPLLDWHMQRLERSCRILDYVWPGDSLPTVIRQAGRAAGAGPSHRLRLLLDAAGSHTLEISPLDPTPSPARVYLNPTPLIADKFWLRHKSTRRPWYAAASAWLAQNPGFFDMMFCNRDGHLSEGSRTNLYILNSAGTWLTPTVDCGALPGVQRQALLDQGAVQEGIVSRQALRDAREIRISNALRGWIPAVLE